MAVADMTDKLSYMAKFYKGNIPIDFKTFMKELENRFDNGKH